MRSLAFACEPFLRDSRSAVLMPKKKYEETPGEQLARCKESIQRLVDTGELDSVGAHEAFQRALRDVLEAPAEPAH